jgi:[methyl-Co(III) methanol-specific corrinoid protein]:coenzyme M methyltransferase
MQKWLLIKLVIFYQGTPDDVYKQVRYAVEAGIDIIAPECAIPLSTPMENLKAIVEAAHQGY